MAKQLIWIGACAVMAGLSVPVVVVILSAFRRFPAVSFRLFGKQFSLGYDALPAPVVIGTSSANSVHTPYEPLLAAGAAIFVVQLPSNPAVWTNSLTTITHSAN